MELLPSLLDMLLMLLVLLLYLLLVLPYHPKAHTHNTPHTRTRQAKDLPAGHWLCGSYGDLSVGGIDVSAYASRTPALWYQLLHLHPQALTNCIAHKHTHTHTEREEENIPGTRFTHPRTRHNLKHTLPGTLIGISG